jgi:SAM-dependent methyltransferase
MTLLPSDRHKPSWSQCDPGYWNDVGDHWREFHPQGFWRLYSDIVNLTLLERWLSPGRVGRILKTDLFDEALTDGLRPFLAARSQAFVGIDLALVTIRAARSRSPGLLSSASDVRQLALREGCFDVVVSNSTLDHFETFDQVLPSLRELHRVLRPGGRLILTMDNRANPAVAIRNLVPFSILNRTGLVPYYVGASCGPRRLRSLLDQAGFDVLETTALMHSPRVLVVAGAAMLERYGSPRLRERVLRQLVKFERLGRWPTRYLTGYFVAVRAVRRAAVPAFAAETARSPGAPASWEKTGLNGRRTLP